MNVYDIKIQEKIEQFFEWVNEPIIQNYYIKDTQNWDALCALLHIISDLERIKSEYYTLESINNLEVIGIMQILYIEQDCMQTLQNALSENKNNGFKLNKYKDIRDIRNKIFGHPSDKQAGLLKTRHFFDIIDKNKQIIRHTYWGIAEEIIGEDINIHNLVLENSEITFDYLQEFESIFKQKFNEIMSQYKVKFDNIFKETNYTFEKLLTKENDNIAINSYEKVIDNEIKNMKIGLKERGIDDFEREIQVLEFLSKKLKTLFYNQTYHDVEFYTYASTLYENIKKLSAKLKELDKII